MAPLSESLILTEQCPAPLKSDGVSADIASLAVPRQRHVLSSVAELYGAPIRAAVESLQQSVANDSGLEAAWRAMYSTRGPVIGGPVVRQSREMAAWATVSAWVTGIASGQLGVNASISDAEQWFMAGASERGLCRFFHRAQRREAESHLRMAAEPKALRDLLPYVLDPHGPGSRLSIRRKPETNKARDRKRSEGVYYTPADVADYMAAEALESLQDEIHPLTVFDPACGTGVFLKAALKQLARRAPARSFIDIASSSLFGADIDPWSLDAAAFVLLEACVSVGTEPLNPSATWHLLRANLVNVDTLRIDPGQRVSQGDERLATRLRVKAVLRGGEIPEAQQSPPEAGSRISLDWLFPELREGPRAVLGNPPYTSLGDRPDMLELSRSFQTLGAFARPTAEIYPLFVEQMIRLTAPQAHGGALVVPLSIACNTGAQFIALRALIANEPGTWQFAFFDREPHALFGEDVKTRNAIAVWKRHVGQRESNILTGPLRKWRSNNRAKLFQTIEFTPVQADIRIGIPKLEGSREADAFTRLVRSDKTLAHAVSGIGRCSLECALTNDATSVFVGATAYNFLNVFRQAIRPERESHSLTEHHLHKILCPTADAAFSVYAALSGHLAFWWWHVHGDGFHVSRGVLESLPIGTALLNSRWAVGLAEIGRELWAEVSLNPKVSANRGRISVGFSAAPFEDRREQIDRTLLEAAGVEVEFATSLKEFSRRTTIAR